MDPAIVEHFDRLAAVTRGDVEITSRLVNDPYWSYANEVANRPVPYYLYDMSTREAEFLFTSLFALDDLLLVPMHPATIKTCDGFEMVVYYSLPAGADSDPNGVPEEPLLPVLRSRGGTILPTRGTHTE